MNYKILDCCIVFYIEHPAKDSLVYRKFSFAGSVLALDEISMVCELICKSRIGRLDSSNATYLSFFLKPLLDYFVTTGVRFPKNSNEWQSFVLDFFKFYLTDTTCSQSSPKTRFQCWTGVIRNTFLFWTTEGAIPIGLLIPSIDRKKTNDESNKFLLGETQAEPLPASKQIQKLTVNVNFAQADDEYLDSVHRDCKKSIDLIKQVCLEHWNNLMVDGEVCAELEMKKKSGPLSGILVQPYFTESMEVGRIELLSQNSLCEKSCYWKISFIRQLLKVGENKECISSKILKSYSFFTEKVLDSVDFEALTQCTAMPIDAFKKLSLRAQYTRFIGILTPVDVAAVCCLLTIEHPEFTSTSLQSAKLLNTRGKYHILMTDVDGSSVFSVDKPRAGQRKYVVLTPLSQKLLKQIVRWTAPIRKIMEQSGDKGWRYLFLGQLGEGKLGVIDKVTHFLASKVSYSLKNLYPDLASAGLISGAFDFRRIRTTMGVIRWFETGSVMEMSRRLGNSYKVVIENYLPAALLQAWNRRIIRRFQNTLIVVAAYGEDYLLEITDFSKIADLQNFVSQLIFEYPPNSSPLAAELNFRINSTSKPAVEKKIEVGASVLNIRLSATSLGYLYAFSELVSRNMNESEMAEIDPVSGLAPLQFVDLARLLRHACENEKVSADLSELMDLSMLRRVHMEAFDMQKEIGEKIKLSIFSEWAM